jgi:class 3 adenylate cyclase
MRTCPRCGEENPERARFCLNCGEPFASEEPARLERRFATPLFADRVGSTTLAEQEDPEVVQAVVERVFDRFAEEVARYDRAERRTRRGPRATFERARTILRQCDARFFLLETEAELAPSAADPSGG